MIISKEYSFEAAHILDLPYSSKCNRLHGHSYRVEVSVFGLLLNEQHMLMDYADLDKIAKPLIEEMDHKFLCPVGHSDTILTTEGASDVEVQFGMTIIKMPRGDFYFLNGLQSTAEVIARHIQEKILEDLPNTDIRVSVKETAKTVASYP